MVDAAIHAWSIAVILMVIPVGVTVVIHCKEMATSVELMVCMLYQACIYAHMMVKFRSRTFIINVLCCGWIGKTGHFYENN